MILLTDMSRLLVVPAIAVVVMVGTAMGTVAAAAQAKMAAALSAFPVK